MSTYQKKVLFWSFVIGIWRFFFWQNYLEMGLWVSISWALTVIFLWLWMWRKQDWIWFLASVFSVLTLVQLIFGLIPVYKHKPSLERFTSSRFPTIRCINTQRPQQLSIQNTNITNTTNLIDTVCSHWAYPIYIWQSFSRADTGSLVIDFGNWNNTYLQGPIWWSLQKTVTGFRFQQTSWLPAVVSYYYIDGDTTPRSSLQKQLSDEYFFAKKEYLETNFPRQRAHSKTLTKIAQRKMKILGFLNREFNDYNKNLDFYLQETKIQ